MELWNNEDIKCYVYDIETPRSFFYALFYNPDEKNYIDFEISQNKNQLYELLKFLDDNKECYFISYNGLKFDAPVLTDIKKNHQSWTTLNDIIENIYNIAQNYIKNDYYMSESNLFAPQLDLMKILHYDNKNKVDQGAGLVSLKRLQCGMNYSNVEENPIDYTLKHITNEELSSEIIYCKNDVDSTENVLQYTIGNVENTNYKSKNKLEMSYNTMIEFGIPCLNYSTTKIGSEIIKKTYAEELGVNVLDLPKKGTFRRTIDLNKCIPSFVKFKTKPLQNFLKIVKNTVIAADEKLNFTVNVNGLNHDIKKGGIHGAVSNKIYTSSDEYSIIDIDVASFYAIITFLSNKAPKHLNVKAFLKGYLKLFLRRIELKPLSKKDTKIKGIVESLKESLVSIFGSSGLITSWMFDKELLYSITLGGEMCILMLIERLNKYECIFSNTDGACFYVHKDEIDNFRNICNKFIEYMMSCLAKLGYSKEVEFVLEFNEYKKLIVSDVNNYLGFYLDDTFKLKGSRFKVDFKLDEDSSFRVCNLAVFEYFKSNTLPETFIKSHKNIYDFTGRQKANRNFNYELVKDDKIIILKQLVRYAITTNGGILYKVKTEECDTNAASKSSVNAPSDYYQPLVQICNKMPDNHQELFDNLDYEWYIDQSYKTIDKIERGIKPKDFKTRRKQQTSQLSMF